MSKENFDIESNRSEIVKKFFTAFHERFGAKLERRFTDFDFDMCEEDAAHVSYMVEREVKPGISVVFEVNADVNDPCVFVGFSMVKSEDQAYFGDKEMVTELRKHYGIDEKKLSDWMICFDYLRFEGEQINLINSDDGYANYLKLFDPEKFDEIVDSVVEQARLHFAKLKQS